MKESKPADRTLGPRVEKFLSCFPSTIFAYIHDHDSNLPVVHSEILDLNRQDDGYGIFFSVNGFNGKRTLDQLRNINAFFVDIDYPDKVARDEESVRAYKNEVLQDLYGEDLHPSAIVETKNGLHAYWILEAPVFMHELNEEQREAVKLRFRDIEEGIINRFDGDPGAKDIARVLRVPGTLHQKDPQRPFEVKLAHFDPETRYKFGDVQQAFMRKPPPDRWAVAQAESAISDEVRAGVEKEYPRLKRPSYQRLLSKIPGTVPDGMRNKALLVAAHACKESGWSLDDTLAHFDTFHGLSLHEIRKTVRSAYDHVYDFGYNNEVMAAVVEPEERTMLSQATSKVLAAETKEARALSNFAQKERYQTYEFVFAERHPHLKYKNRGDFYDYKDGVYRPLQTEEIRSVFLREMQGDGLLNFRKVSAVNDKIACFKSIDGRTFDHEDENPNPNILNMRNGLLDISSYRLAPHTPLYLSTNQIPLEYIEGAQAPRWQQFVMEIMDGDVEQVRLLRQIAGYALTADTKYAKAFILFGMGANGKSLFTRLLARIVGKEYVSTLSLTTITRQFGLVGLVGKKVNLIDEISGNYFESNVIKGIISGERMSAEVKYRPDPVEFTPTAKLVFSVNELPKINDTTPGLYRRFMIVPFTRSFALNPDVELEAKLVEELPGILNWAIEGLRDLRASGAFLETRKNLEALNDFRVENSPFLEFLHASYEPVPAGQEAKYGVQMSHLYEQYKAYCASSGYKAKSIATFSREISHTQLPGWKLIKTHDGRAYHVHGIRATRNLAGDAYVYDDR